MVDIGTIMAYESGELDEEQCIAMFQTLINDGSVWKLQGCYGRTANALLQAGICTPCSQTV